MQKPLKDRAYEYGAVGFHCGDFGDSEFKGIALLSQEGSVIAFVAMTRGVVP